MTLRASEVAQVAAELWPALKGAVVQHAFAHRPGRAYLELRVPGKSVTLHLCVEPKLARVSIVDAHPKGVPGEPLPWQQVLRRDLVGERLTGLSADERKVDFVFDTLTVSFDAHTLLLCAAGRVVAGTAVGRARLNRGQEMTPPETAFAPGPSRLKPTAADFPFARAAEALLAENESQLSLKATQAPLLSKLKRLERTLVKVEAEAARGADADRHRRDGELLKQNLSRVSRGAKTVELDEYLPDGNIEKRTLKLDPARTPKQQAEWHFHQYRRLTRGAQLSAERAKKLRIEAEGLREKLKSLEASELPALSLARPEKAAAPRPFREYDGSGGKIWVGKGALDNDALTFHVAKAHHLWLHARGLPGAHVVVPLERGESVPQELLLDAATLAAHHSDAKGEPRAEVSYTLVKFVRKTKGAPGAVTYTREKTFALRLEPTRLQRLLATER